MAELGIERAKRLVHQERFRLAHDRAPQRDALAVTAGQARNSRVEQMRDAQDARGFVDPPDSIYRVNGKPAIGLAISMREGGDVLQLGDQVKASVDRAIGNLPIGINTFLVSNQPDVVDVAIGDFTTSLYQAVAIILAVSFLTLGVRPGAVVAIAIPVTLAAVFLIMQVMGIDLHRVSLGALIIALALMVDDAMTTVDATLRGLSSGLTMEQASSWPIRNSRLLC